MNHHPLPLALKRILCVPIFLLFLFPLTTLAQQALKGKVTDDAKSPLAGVSVAIKNTHRGTVTAPDGTYSITAANGETLVFTFIGYVTQELVVSQIANYNITLAPNVQNLDQMVVIGYGIQKKSSLTGSVASVNSKTLNELPVASVQQALQGRLPIMVPPDPTPS